MDGLARGHRAFTIDRVVPALAGTAAFAIGVVNVLGALTRELTGGLRVLRNADRVPELMVAHRLELPVGLALIVASVYLLRRRQGALWATVGLLLTVGVLDVLKGFEREDALAFVVAAVLVLRRDAFCVRFDSGAMPRTVMAAGAFGGLVVVCARLDPYLLWPVAGMAFLAVAWLVGRRPRPPYARLPAADVARVIEAHGTDTLSAFKLRADLDHLRSACGEGLLSYRVVGGVLLVAGDPVGPAGVVTPLLAAARDRARSLGLRLAVLGASDELAAAARAMGLRAVYIGDEAVVDTAGFSLEGHGIKKVRQAVRRIERNGYTIAVHAHADLSDAELTELEDLAVVAREGAAERGFSMSLDSLRGEHLGRSWLVIARDERGAARGMLHFTPTPGRAAASLGFMCRDPDTPNGLTDFLVVGAIRMLAEHGVAELSLNFAAFSRYLREPVGGWQRLAGRLASRGDRFLQIESLYRFSRKFGPRWVPRHLVYESHVALPRTALAAMSAEGQLAALIGR